MDAAIYLRNVSKRFGPTQAVQGVSLEIRPGEMVGLVGPDGAGKTTLARLAAGALAPSEGRVEPESRGRVGYLTGRFSLYPDLTVWENLTFFARMYGMRPKETAAEAERLLEWVGMLPFKKRLTGALSGGMRQKLALCCAVIHKPPILILDEPTTAVDPVARMDFWRLLRHQAEAGTAVLVTTPYLDEAEYCHRVGLLHEGRLLAVGTAAELKKSFPYRMLMLTQQDGEKLRRTEITAAARALPGHQWSQLLGTGVRVALAAGDGLPAAPPGYALNEVEPNLEDVYLWRSGLGQEV